MNYSLISLNLLSLLCVLFVLARRFHGFARVGIVAMTLNHLFYLTFYISSGLQHPLGNALLPFAGGVHHFAVAILLGSWAYNQSVLKCDESYYRLPTKPFLTATAMKLGSPGGIHVCLALACFAFLSACSTAPEMSYNPNTGEFKGSLGRSLAEDTSSEAAKFKFPNGAEMAYFKEGKKQSQVPSTLTRWFFADSMFGNATSAATTINKTLTAGKSKDLASTNQLKAVEAVEQTKRANFVPELLEAPVTTTVAP